MSATAVIYARVSTSSQELDGQVRELRQEAQRLGLTVAVEYIEKVTATGRVPRAEYDRLMRELTDPKRPWSTLLVWSLDRFSREEKFTRAVEAVWQVERAGVRFASLREPFLGTPSDGKPTLERELLLALLPVLASWESRRRSERVRLAAAEVKDGRRKPRSKWGNRWKVTREAVERAIALRSRGKSWADVAQAVRLPTETIRASVWKAKRGLVAFPSATVIEDWNAGVRTSP